MAQTDIFNGWTLFSNKGSAGYLEFKILNFGQRFFFIVRIYFGAQNFKKLLLYFTEMWRFNNFQNDGCSRILQPSRNLRENLTRSCRVIAKTMFSNMAYVSHLEF